MQVPYSGAVQVPHSGQGGGEDGHSGSNATNIIFDNEEDEEEDEEESEEEGEEF